MYVLTTVHSIPLSIVYAYNLSFARYTRPLNVHSSSRLLSARGWVAGTARLSPARHAVQRPRSPFGDRLQLDGILIGRCLARRRLTTLKIAKDKNLTAFVVAVREWSMNSFASARDAGHYGRSSPSTGAIVSGACVISVRASGRLRCD